MTASPRQSGAQELDLHWSQMMALAQDGDGHVYERLLGECTPLIRRVARGRGVPADRVDDVVQDVLLTIHRARHTYDPGRSFAAWLQTIARRRAIDALRRLGRRERREIHAPLQYEDYPDPDSALEPGFNLDVAGGLADALASLPPGQREAIEALAIRQLSLDEAAAASGKSKGALKVNMHRALKTLRARFARVA